MNINLILTTVAQLDSIPIKNGNLICCEDLSAYFDVEKVRTRLGNCIQYATFEMLKNAPNPSIQRIYVVTQTKTVYKWDGQSKIFVEVTTYNEIISLISAAQELTPVTLSKSGKRVAPRTLANYVYMNDGRTLEEALQTLKEENEQVRIICKMNVVLANYDNQKIFDIPFPISNYDLEKYPMVVITKYGIVNQGSFTLTRNQIILNTSYPELVRNDEVVFIFHYSMKLDGEVDAAKVNGTPLYISTTAPANPAPNTVWIDTASGSVKQFINGYWNLVIKNPQDLRVNMETLRSHINITSTVSSVPLNITGYDQNNDVLMAFRNSVHMTPGVDYTILPDNSAIQPVDDPWEATEEYPFFFSFIVFKGLVNQSSDDMPPMEQLQYIAQELSSLQSDVSSLKDNFDAQTVNGTPIYVAPEAPQVSEAGAIWLDTTSGRIKELINGTWCTIMQNGALSGGVSISKSAYTLSTAQNFVPIGATEYDRTVDTLMVYQNGLYLEQNIDYKVSNDNRNIVSLDGEWNGTQYSITFDFIIFHGTHQGPKPSATLNTEKLPGNIDPLKINQYMGIVTEKNFRNYEFEVSGTPKAFAILVFKNGKYLEKNTDFSIDGNKITISEGILKPGDKVDAIVFDLPNSTGEMTKVTSKFFDMPNPYITQTSFTLTKAKSNRVYTHLPGFEMKDAMMVFLNGVYLVCGEDYYIEGDYIVNAKGNWDATKEDLIFNFVMFTNSSIFDFDITSNTNKLNVDFVLNETMTPLLFQDGELLESGVDYTIINGVSIQKTNGTWKGTTSNPVHLELIVLITKSNDSVIHQIQTIPGLLDMVKDLVSKEVSKIHK